MVIDSGHEWLGIQWVKVLLYFHIREQIGKRPTSWIVRNNPCEYSD